MKFDRYGHIFIWNIWSNIFVPGCLIGDIGVREWGLNSDLSGGLSCQLLRIGWCLTARLFVHCANQRFGAQQIFHMTRFMIAMRNCLSRLFKTRVICIRYQRNVDSKFRVLKFTRLFPHWRVLGILSWKRIMVSGIFTLLIHYFICSTVEIF